MQETTTAPAPASIEVGVSTKDMANRLGVCPETLRKWYNEGRVPGLRLGRNTTRFDPAAVVEALQRHEAARPARSKVVGS